ncbi:S-layer homology domain-containing protein [Paenibacillus sp. SI8]|uniref:S-layer homology domain-containing protein n=1 Tax=unclassified Paenibacillus TaxID=185978 RepID=UPI003465E76C
MIARKWKKGFATWLSVLLVLTLVPFGLVPANVAHAAAASINYDFEDGTVQGWGPAWGGASNPVAVNEDMSVTGNTYSLAIPVVFNGGNWQDAVVGINVNGSSAIDLSQYSKLDLDVYVPTSLTGKFAVELAMNDPSWEKFAANYNITINQSPVYKQVNGVDYQKLHVTTDFSTISAAKLAIFKQLVVKLAGQSATFTGNLYIDNIKLTSKSDISYDFEAGAVQGWGPAWGGASNPVAVNEDMSVTGNTYSLAVPVDFNGGSWQEAAVGINVNGSSAIDLSQYSKLDLDVYVPTSLTGKFALQLGMNDPSWQQFKDSYNITINQSPVYKQVNGVDYQKLHVSTDFSGIPTAKLATFKQLVVKLAGQSATFSGNLYMDNITLASNGSNTEPTTPKPPSQKEAPATDYTKPVPGSDYTYTFDTNNNGWFDAWGGAFQTNYPVKYSNDLTDGALQVNVDFTGGNFDETNIGTWISGEANSKFDLSTYEKVEYDVFLPIEIKAKSPNGIAKIGTVLDKNYYEFQAHRDYKLSELTPITIGDKQYLKTHVTAPLNSTKRNDSGQLIIRLAGYFITYSGPIYVDNVQLITYKTFQSNITAPAANDKVSGTVNLEANLLVPPGQQVESAMIVTPTGNVPLTLTNGKYVGQWDSTAVQDGFYKLTLQAASSTGATTSQELEVQVKNSATNIAFVNPEAYSVISSVYDVTADIVNPAGIHSATLEVNGTKYPMTLSSGNRYSASFDTTSLADGVYTLIIDVKDNQGQLTTEFIDVIVHNGTSDAPMVTRNGSDFMLGQKKFDFVGYNTYNLPFFYPSTTGSNQKVVEFTTDGRKLEKVIPTGTSITFEQLVNMNFSEAQKLGMTVVRTWLFNTNLSDKYTFYNGDYSTFNEDQFKRFDYILNTAKRYNLKVIPTLSNYWGDYGGMRAIAKSLNIDVLNFYSNEAAQTIFKNYIDYVTNRTNTANNLKYKDDPTIFAWDIMNEPRMDRSDDKSSDLSQWDPTGEKMGSWLNSIAGYIKSKDSNHLVIAGAEGQGYQGFAGLTSGFGQNPVLTQIQDNLDSVSFHPYPNEHWATVNDIMSYFKMDDFVTNFAQEAKKNNRPVLLQEFGLRATNAIRDLTGHEVEPSDAHYQAIKDVWYKMMLAQFRRAGGNGSNIWMFQAFQQQDTAFAVSALMEDKIVDKDYRILKIMKDESKLLEAISGKVLFADTANDSRLSYINEAVHLGYMSGVDSDHFKPADTMSAMEFAAVLSNAKIGGSITANTGNLTANTALKMLGSALGVDVSAVSNTLYDANKLLTRAEAAELVIRMADVVNPAGQGSYDRVNLDSVSLNNVVTKTLVKGSVLTEVSYPVKDVSVTNQLSIEFTAQSGAQVQVFNDNVKLYETVASGSQQTINISLPSGVYAANQLALVVKNTLGQFEKVYLPTVTVSTSSSSSRNESSTTINAALGSNNNNDTKVIVDEAALKTASNGRVLITVDQGKKEILLPVNAAQIVGDNKLTIQHQNVSIDLPKQTLEALRKLAAGKGITDGNIQLLITSVSGQDQTTLLGKSSEKARAVLTAPGEVLEFTLAIVGKDGSQTKLSQFDTPVTLRFKVKEGVSKDLLGVYYIADDGTLEYVPSRFEDGYLVVEVSHFSKYAVLEYKKSFSDVASTSWAANAILKMAAKHVIEGVSDDTFEPNRNVTRAEFASMIVRALEIKAKSQHEFKDVAAGAWYASALSAAYESGLIQGYDSDTFAPNAAISREEMAVILVRAYEMKTGTKLSSDTPAEYTDQASISPWAIHQVSAAFAKGLLQGRDQGLFAPSSNLSRAEAAQALTNILEK